MNHICEEEKRNSLAIAKSMLNEMAMSLDCFRDRLLHLQFQLIENWCLCKWCQLFDLDNDNFNHWLVEFKAYAQALQRIKLKSGDKKDVLTSEFIVNYEYNDPKAIFETIEEKFAEEEIRDESQVKQVSGSFSKAVEKLIDAICGSAPISTYITHEFNLDNEQEA